MRATRTLVVFSLLLLPALTLAQSPGGQPTGSPSSPTIRTTSREVLLDLVVRDKKEKLVTDLKASEVEVYEDGVKQQAKIFRLISGEEQTAADLAEQARQSKSGEKTGQINPLREINLVSIVFDQMGPRTREYARNAALQFLKNELVPNTYVAVFSLDYHLNALINYTRNVEALKAAIEHASTGNYSQFAKDSAQVLTQVGVDVTRDMSGVSVSAVVDPFTTAGQALTAAEQGAPSDTALIMAKILHDQQLMASYQTGMRSVMALMLLAREQAKLPGRKTVIYMAEGLSLPPNNLEPFRVAISEANRANVTFYAVDVRGLTTSDAAQASINSLRYSGAISRAQLGSESNQSTAATANLIKQDDWLGYSLQSANTQASMAELADSTGGFLIANTNDFNKPIAHIMEDVRTHYELTYTPTSENYDGHFRKIEVKLARSGLKLRSRNGYYALPDLNGQPLMPFEMPALQVLNLSPLPNAIPFHAGAFQFRQGAGGTQCALTLEVAISNLGIFEDKSKSTIRVHPSFLALIKDAKGQVVAKISRDLPTEVPTTKRENLQRGSLTFSQPLELPNGRYTLESVLLDRESNHASAKRTVLVVQGSGGSGGIMPNTAVKNAENSGGKLALSSIVVARRIDPLEEGRDPFNPLEFGGGKVTPTLADITSTAATGTETALYFVVYPDHAVGAPKPELELEFFVDGKPIATAAPSLTAADDSGAIPIVTSAKFNPGQYEVRVTVKQGTEAAENSAFFRLNPFSAAPAPVN